MSATLYYQAVAGTRLNIGAPSSFMDAMTRAFGASQPWALTFGDYNTLRGLAAGLESTDQAVAIAELQEEVGKGHEIRVWAEY